MEGPISLLKSGQPGAKGTVRFTLHPTACHVVIVTSIYKVIIALRIPMS